MSFFRGTRRVECKQEGVVVGVRVRAGRGQGKKVYKI